MLVGHNHKTSALVWCPQRYHSHRWGLLGPIQTFEGRKATLQKFVSYHCQIYNHFNHERHLETRQTYKQKRSAALIEWFQICAS